MRTKRESGLSAKAEDRFLVELLLQIAAEDASRERSLPQPVSTGDSSDHERTRRMLEGLLPGLESEARPPLRLVGGRYGARPVVALAPGSAEICDLVPVRRLGPA